MKKTVCLLTILFASTALTLLGQSAEESITWVIRIKAHAGKELGFETAYKRHLQWHADNKDTMAWHGWQYVAGPYTGQYAITVAGQEWKNFDRGEMGKADMANALELVVPHVQERQVWYSQNHLDLSNPLPPGSPAPAMLAVYSYRIKPPQRSQFVTAISRMHSALQDAGWKGHYSWSEVVQGATGIQFNVIVPRSKFADFAAPDPSLIEVIEAKLGRDAAADVRNDFWTAVESFESHILMFREDLSYIP